MDPIRLGISIVIVVVFAGLGFWSEEWQEQRKLRAVKGVR